MANLDPSAVTITVQYPLGGMASKSLVRKQAIVVLTAQGSATNKIVATAFGLTYISAVTAVVKTDDTRLIGSPAYDHTYIQLMDPAVATNLGADFSGTYKFTVEGISVP